ncbi:protein of unknown function [Candidatus Hydrogenisulfobacillus filiaventi]|uniref:Uncharacterized protein n=1 Tax=Candidatus Hydrogenisulfobacillus filiaventi TaxID=2707344 RepID=A0A6F8ZI42_9FIRM|nr:protein of unknown function [Candidatus Hydrogenisulfobacillus filiaventi]
MDRNDWRAMADLRTWAATAVLWSGLRFGLRDGEVGLVAVGRPRRLGDGSLVISTGRADVPVTAETARWWLLARPGLADRRVEPARRLAGAPDGTPDHALRLGLAARWPPVTDAWAWMRMEGDEAEVLIVTPPAWRPFARAALAATDLRELGSSPGAATAVCAVQAVSVSAALMWRSAS